MRIEFLCISVLRVASGPRVKLASCNSALFVALWFILFYVLLCVLVFFSPFSIAITSLGEERANLSAFHTWFVIATFSGPFFTLRGDLLIVVSCVSLFLCFSVLLALRLPRLRKRERELILALFVLLFEMRVFGFICFLFLLVSGKGCAL